MASDYWCALQIEAREDVGKSTYTCCAHLHEGRAFKCWKKKEDVYFNPDRIDFHHGLSIPDDPDFEPRKGKARMVQKIAREQGNVKRGGFGE